VKPEWDMVIEKIHVNKFKWLRYGNTGYPGMFQSNYRNDISSKSNPKGEPGIFITSSEYMNPPICWPKIKMKN